VVAVPPVFVVVVAPVLLPVFPVCIDVDVVPPAPVFVVVVVVVVVPLPPLLGTPPVPEVVGTDDPLLLRTQSPFAGTIGPPVQPPYGEPFEFPEVQPVGSIKEHPVLAVLVFICGDPKTLPLISIPGHLPLASIGSGGHVC
jgi:hypothetical protein